MDVGEEIKKELSRSTSISEVKSNLVRRGYLEKDIDEGLQGLMLVKTEEKNKNNKILGIKELFDRIGYGFASQQFINILFMLSGASLFLIGFINGLKTVIAYFSSGFLKEYSKIKYIGKNIISASGVVFGLSFLGMAFAVVLHNPVLFAFSSIVGTFGIIAHGDLYVDFYNKILKNERRKNFLRFISYFGIIITAAALILSGFLMDLFPITGTSININLDFLNLVEPIGFKVYGYLLAFEVTAIMFILSGYLMSFMDEAKESYASSRILESINEYFKESRKSSKVFIKNNKIMLLTIATILTTVVQVLGNSYYGVFIYQHFKDELLKGFMNVAVIFVIALIASISGSLLTKRFAKSLGEAPMLVFGTLLIAVLPATMYFNPHLYSIGLATALSVVGGSIVGVAQGLIAERLMDEEALKTYFSTLGYISLWPTLVIATLGAILAQLLMLQTLFIILAAVLAFVIMPLYFTIVLIVDKEYRNRSAA